jgi:hypothetical protein
MTDVCIPPEDDTEIGSKHVVGKHKLLILDSCVNGIVRIIWLALTITSKTINRCLQFFSILLGFDTLTAIVYWADGMGSSSRKQTGAGCVWMHVWKWSHISRWTNIYLLKHSLHEGHAIAWAVRQQLPIAEPWVQSLVTSCEICDG